HSLEAAEAEAGEPLVVADEVDDCHVFLLGAFGRASVRGWVVFLREGGHEELQAFTRSTRTRWPGPSSPPPLSSACQASPARSARRRAARGRTRRTPHRRSLPNPRG